MDYLLEARRELDFFDSVIQTEAGKKKKEEPVAPAPQPKGNDVSFGIKVLAHETVARTSSGSLKIQVKINDEKIDDEVLKKGEEIRSDIMDDARLALNNFEDNFRIQGDGHVAYKTSYGDQFLDISINGVEYSPDQMDDLFVQDLASFERDDHYEVNVIRPQDTRYESLPL